MYPFIGSQRGVAAYFWIAGLGMGDWGIVIVSSLEMLCISLIYLGNVMYQFNWDSKRGHRKNGIYGVITLKTLPVITTGRVTLHTFNIFYHKVNL